MYLTVLSSFFRITVVTMAVLYNMQVSVALAAQTAAGGTDFEIPISELNKVKKKSPAKHETKKTKKKKKKTDSKLQESSLKTAYPNEPAGLAKIPPVELVKDTKSEPVPQKSPDGDKPLPNPEETRIYHSPYSFVVAGKHTVINAVINSKADIKEINCSLRMAGGEAQTPVKMVKVEGTRFTYRATLPAMAPESTSLGYTIVVIDSSGKETRSQEFVTPVASSPVVPAWQLESAGEAVSVEQNDANKPLKELSGQGLSK